MSELFLLSVPSNLPISRIQYHREKRKGLANYFDGEGSITIGKTFNNDGHHKSPTYFVYTQVSATDRPLIQEFYNYFKVGYFCLTIIKKKMASERIFHFHWEAKGNQAITVLKILLPYFRLKKEQAELAIEFQENKIVRRYPKLNPDDLAFREKYRQLIRKCNRSSLL